MNHRWSDRFRYIPASDWILYAIAFVLDVAGFIFSIGFSVKMSEGFTLFGDTSKAPSGVETSGPTQADLLLLSVFWILSVLVLAYLVYVLLIQKREPAKEVVHKEVINGKVVEMKEKNVSENESK